MSFHRLLALFERNRDSGQPLVLCTVIRTAGSTYAKPGAQMLIAEDGEYAGLLSGGCLEGDLREHARAVAATGVAQVVSYDMRSSTDQLFGLGAGCEGAMDVLLTRVSAAEQWQPLAGLAQTWRAHRPGRAAWVTSTRDPQQSLGALLDESLTESLPPITNGFVQFTDPSREVFVAEVSPPPRLLLAGGGPDARPVATLAAFLGWQITVLDHRAHYLVPAHFPPGAELIETRAADAARRLRLDDFDGAVIMSHHLESDLHYLRALAQSRVPYVGLLGPAPRREKLLADLGEPAALLHGRLRAPVGLDLGGRSPESIALAIVAEIHAVFAGRATSTGRATSASRPTSTERATSGEPESRPLPASAT